MIRRFLLILLVLLLVMILGGGLYVYQRPLRVLAWAERRNLEKSGYRKSAVATPNGNLAVWESGQGPVLMLLHGAGDQAGVWSGVAPALRARYRVLIPDLPGHGDSEPAAGPLPMGVVLGGLERLVDARAGQERVALVGSSFGAWVAMVYAQRHPERVARIVAINGGALRGERPDLSLVPATREEARRLMDNLMDRGSTPPPAFVLDDVVRQAQGGALSRLYAGGADLERYLLDGRLAEVTPPVDLLWGESDRVVPLSYARRMEAQLPAARLTPVPRCGHIPMRECPASFARSLEAVLEQTPPGPGTPPGQPSGGKRPPAARP